MISACVNQFNQICEDALTNQITQLFQMKNPADVFCQIKLVFNRATVDNRQNTFYTLYKKCSVPIITEMIHLCVILGSSKHNWSEACQNLVSDAEVVSDVDICMKKGMYQKGMVLRGTTP